MHTYQTFWWLMKYKINWIYCVSQKLSFLYSKLYKTYNLLLIFYYLLISGKDKIWSLNIYNLNFKKMKSPPFSCYLSFIKSNQIFICVGQSHEYIDIVYLHAIYFISPSNLFDVVYEIKNKYGCFYLISNI